MDEYSVEIKGMGVEAELIIRIHIVIVTVDNCSLYHVNACL